MGIMNFFIAILVFMAGFGIACMMTFDWQAFWNYRLKRDEMAMKYKKEDGKYGT